MRDTFSGYYQPEESEFSVLWEDCLFVLDANVLLNLYRYSPQTSQVLIDILTQISDRLWIPHQVAFEYQENRLSAIAGQVKVYDEISQILQNTQKNLENSLSREHLSLDVETLLEKVKIAFAEIEEDLDQHRQQHPDLFNNDHIRDTITTIFNGKVGGPYSQDELTKFYRAGDERYENKIPPGYEDRKKDGVKRYGNLILKDKYGDLIAWFQIIDKAKSENKPMIFVTDDTKEDWWWIAQGKTVGPRPELITEIKNRADVSFYIYTPRSFMLYAGDYLEIEVTDEIADEVQGITEEKRSWKDELVAALVALGGEATLSQIYYYIKSTTSRILPESWEATIRRTLQTYSSDTETYSGGEDLFEHLGRGIWGLREIDEDNESSDSET